MAKRTDFATWDPPSDNLQFSGSCAIISVMSNRTTLILAVAAGFIGGIASQHLAITPVFAKEPASAAKEIRAEKFVIVDENGLPRGAFGINPKDGWPTIEFTGDKDELRRVKWYPAGWTGKGKSTVVPPQ
jgi:hypothetical protein